MLIKFQTFARVLEWTKYRCLSFFGEKSGTFDLALSSVVNNYFKQYYLSKLNLLQSDTNAHECDATAAS